MKKVLREMQTLRTGCSKVEQKIPPCHSLSLRRKESALAVVSHSQNFLPAADPFPGAQDGQNLIS